MVAKHVASNKLAVGSFPLILVPFELLTSEFCHWLPLAAVNHCEQFAWTVWDSEGLCVTQYPPASKLLVHSPLPCGFDEARQSSARVRLMLGTMNIMSSGDGKTLATGAHAFVPNGGRIGIIAEQAAWKGYHIIGVQESTSRPSRLRVGSFIRLIAGACDRRNRRIELWLNVDNPYTHTGKSPRCCIPEDATLIAEGQGYAVFSLSAAYISCDILIAHAPHSGRPEKERIDFWASVQTSV